MKLTAEQRRALGVLAGSQRGATDALLLVYGFDTEMLAGLVRAGLATVETETVRARGRLIEVGRFLITDAGRQALPG